MPIFSQSQISLARLSRLMAWLSAAGFVLVPAIITVIFLYPDQSAALMFKLDHLGVPLDSSVPFAYRVAALICALIPAAFTMWALWSLRALFLHYAQGVVFSRAALSALNHVAIALFAGVIMGFVMQAPISAILSWHLGAGHRAISLGFGSGDISTLFMAGVVLVIARVMAEARRVADENESFV